MKLLPVFTLFSFLALFCCFLGVASKGPREDECDQYPRPVKGKPFICTEEYAPVCGTNGKTYSNKCLLCAARWKTGENIGIKKEGKCEEKDECSEFPEPPKGKPAGCTMEYRPVCGSNGVTYGNKCAFCAAKRQSGGKITIKHEGQCEQKDECSEIPEPPKGKPAGCTMDYRPVCGSNGVTYGNKCAFCTAKRQSGGKITIKHEGQCEQKDVCSEFPKPLTFCTKEYNPVCGTDGSTYGNKCMLCLARQETGKDIDVKHKGKCEEKDECSEFPEPPKGKPAECTMEYRPVCGSNGVTYGNKCAFCAAKRQSGGKITIKHEGQCEQKDECSEIPEPPKGKPAGCTMDYRPVCGSNGVTYGNKCAFCTAKRQSGGKITIKHEGQCEQKPDDCKEPEKGKLPKCTREYQPVCGTNQVTYANKCLFCEARRESQGTIEIQHDGECNKKGK